MERDIHVVMIPWLAFGHMIPFLELSIALAKAGIHVSFISTPRNITRLSKPPQNLTGVINFVEFPLPREGSSTRLPEGAEATIDIPSEDIQYLKVAYDLLQDPIHQFISNLKPDWIIVDILTHWAIEIARGLEIPCIAFSVYSAAAIAFIGPTEYLYGDGQKRSKSSPEGWTKTPEWVTFPSSVKFHSFEALEFQPGFFIENVSKITDAERIAKVLRDCQVLAIRSCMEIEDEYLSLLKKLYKQPIIPVGSLIRQGEERKVSNGPWFNIFKWLDSQKPRSVLYVGFGSEYKLTKEQIFEIAYGLELSELPFLWALGNPSWAIDNLDALPLGFNERTKGKGIVNIGWTPQSEVLRHRSIGGSLFHAGWGSVIESLQHGHVLVLLPFILDQGLNARLMVDYKLGVEVERKEDGSFSREDIAKSLKQAMVSEEGEKVRARAREFSVVFGNGDMHQGYISEFVEYILEK